MPTNSASHFSSDGRFAHCAPPTLISVTMSICCTCGEYIGASPDANLLDLVEGLHRCPGRLLDFVV